MLTATRVFYEKGYEGTSIQDIANELQILKGSLYHYIRSKEDLLIQVLEAVHENMRGNLEAVQGTDADVLARIATFVEHHVTMHVDNYMAARVFVHDVNAMPADARKRIVKVRDEYEAAFRGLLVRGVADGTVCPDVNTKLSAKAILTMLNSVHLWYSPGGDLTADDIAQEYTALVVAALQCDPKSHRHGHRAKWAGARKAGVAGT